MSRLRTSDFISEEPLRRIEKQQEFVNAEGFIDMPRYDLFNPDPATLRKLPYATLLDRNYSIFSFKLQSYRHKSYEIWPSNYAFADEDRAYRRETQPEGTELSEFVDPDDSQHRWVYLFKVERGARTLLSYPVEMSL